MSLSLWHIWNNNGEGGLLLVTPKMIIHDIRLYLILIISWKYKVDVQNNILHTLREASYVGKKTILWTHHF